MNDPYAGYPVIPPYSPPPNRTNGRSVAALVLGILSLVLPGIGFLFGIAAIILGAIGIRETDRTGERGKGLAVAGLVCGLIGTVVYTVLFILILIAALHAPEAPAYPEPVQVFDPVLA